MAVYYGTATALQTFTSSLGLFASGPIMEYAQIHLDAEKQLDLRLVEEMACEGLWILYLRGGSRVLYSCPLLRCISECPSAMEARSPCRGDYRNAVYTPTPHPPVASPTAVMICAQRALDALDA